MDEQQALLRFCAAQRELTHIDDATSVERRQHGRSATAFREMLKEQMVGARADCVPVMVGGQQKYVVLKPTLAGGATVTCDAVMRILRGMRYDGGNSGSSTIEEWVEAALKTALTSDSSKRDATEHGTHRLSIVVKKPDQAKEVRQVHPMAASRIQETVHSLHNATEAVKALRKRDDTRRKELKAVCKETEESVANHLHRHDPEHGTRRVKLVHGAAEATCYLRRKQSNRTVRPTVRTALPAIRQTIQTLREEANMDAAPTWDSFRWLTSPPTLAKIERHVAQCLQRLHNETTKTRVVLTSVSS